MPTRDDIEQIYWHRNLPPADAELVGEHVLEATSDHVQGVLDHHGDEWAACYENLMEHAQHRLVDEIQRLGGSGAHVFRETIEERRNDALGEAWLYGRFTYILFKRKAQSNAPRDS
jgi:hypothetical protein